MFCKEEKMMNFDGVQNILLGAENTCAKSAKEDVFLIFMTEEALDQGEEKDNKKSEDEG